MKPLAPTIELACPIDGSPLDVVQAGALRCGSGHCFDRARQGYYNLLVVQHKASRDPGDSRDMVMARQRFLATGAFQAIAAHAARLTAGLFAQECQVAPCTVLDAGCGEGYYLAYIAGTSGPDNTLLRFAGTDISKQALQAAARRRSDCFWAVATNRHLPFATGGIGLILSMFGFPVCDEFARLQPSGAHLLLVDPGPDHLLELRTIIYPVVNSTAPPAITAAIAAGYALVDEHSLRFPIKLTSAQQIADLLRMTPHDHRATRAGREALARLDCLDLTGDVLFRLLRREVR
jgi:23S rRNA (guanine745-N1)-methyltransferase